jgi:hypothetical protein
VIPVSAMTGRNFYVLKESIFHALDIIRIYTKVPGKAPDLAEPFVLKRGSTLEELALKIQKDLSVKLKFARLSLFTPYAAGGFLRDTLMIEAARLAHCIIEPAALR